MTNSNNTTLLVDLTSRNLPISTVAVTRLETGEIVLRKGVTVCGMHDICKQNIDCPIILMGDYQAISSAGFVSIVGDGAKSQQIHIAGGAGFEWASRYGMIGGGLRPFRYRPVGGRGYDGVILPSARIEQIETHDRNSNPRTAEAVVAGAQMIADLTGDIIILEGQSDRVVAWKLSTRGGTIPIYPPEHREDIFKVVESPEIINGDSEDPKKPIASTHNETEDVRVRSGVTEHKHDGYDYWHPAARVHSNWWA